MSSSPKNLCRRRWHQRALEQLRSYLHARYRALASFASAGAWGERAAARHLERRGLVLVRRNWRRFRFEADIVAVDARTIVIVEVKTRHERFRSRYPARRAVHARKRARLQSLARGFMRNNGPLCRRFLLSKTRLDAVEVYFRAGPCGVRRVSTIVWHRGIA